MKSIEAQLEEARTKYFAQEKEKGFNEAAIRTAWKEKVMSASSVEEKLSIGKSLFTESTRRITRNNGSGIVESVNEGRVEQYMRKLKMSFREASVFLGLPDPGPNAKPSANFNESLRKKWKRYSPWIKESDLNTLVERGIEP